MTDKVHHITTIARVAADLDQDDDWLRVVANKMAIEDGFEKIRSRRSATSASKT